MPAPQNDEDDDDDDEEEDEEEDGEVLEKLEQLGKGAAKVRRVVCGGVRPDMFSFCFVLHMPHLSFAFFSGKARKAKVG